MVYERSPTEYADMVLVEGLQPPGDKAFTRKEVADLCMSWRWLWTLLAVAETIGMAGAIVRSLRQALSFLARL